MRIKNILLFFSIFIFGIVFCGCGLQNQDGATNLLIADDLIDITLSAPEGSGANRTLTIRFMYHGEKRSVTINEVSGVDLEGYDNEKKEQIIVYREFWFPDIKMAHAGIPLWPTVYEYDLDKGFVVASAKHKDYFATYAENAKKELGAGREYMSDPEMLALTRLIYAAEKIADGSFVPASPYSRDNVSNGYYKDVYELVKDIDE